jgi:hypothetical protein
MTKAHSVRIETSESVDTLDYEYTPEGLEAARLVAGYFNTCDPDATATVWSS